MKKMIFFSIIIMALLYCFSCSNEKKLLRKAAIAVDHTNYEEAVSHYDEILQKDKDSYFGNAGKGIVLSEYLEKHEQAIPYLEKALEKSPGKTKMKLNYDLGKSYQFIGNYPRALFFYEKAMSYNNIDNPDYDAFLSKRVADCRYALEHPEVASASKQWVKNVGKPINTPMPEYSPVFYNNTMIFTSRRQDHKKEKKNGVDGKYFENMYICKSKSDSFSEPVKYTLPNYSKNSKYNRHNESVLSVSSDYKKLFIYRNGKIYESEINDSSNAKSARKMGEEINFSYLQNHASISSDGKTLFFSSESDKGVGGADIFRAVKNDDGNWSEPQLLSINTEYNEDSPFIANDGILYFSSNGLPGYGGYDVYKTKLVNGQWTTPENLGQPINSPADDIYFALNPNSTDGYYASGRQGGLGDMDIYQVHYVAAEIKDCDGYNEIFAITAEPESEKSLVYNIGIKIPETYKGKIKSINWALNAEAISITEAAFTHTFISAGTYTIFSKVVIECDTCPSLISFCSQKNITAGETGIVILEPEDKKDTGIEKLQEKNGVEMPGDSYYSDEELTSLGWNTSPVYFDSEKYDLSANAQKVLDQNIQILKSNQNLKIVINGYADSGGSEAYNINLSLKRANKVKQYILDNGVEARAIRSIKGYGESELVNNCTKKESCVEADHAKNRRVIFKVIKMQIKPVAIQE